MVKAANENKLTVDPSPLEVHADKVTFTMSAELPPKLLKPKKVFTISTYYRYGTNEQQLEEIEFRADDYPNSNTEATAVSQEYSFPFKAGMERGNIEIQGKASNPKNGAYRETPRLAIAEGLITTSTLAQPSYAAAYADHGYNDQEELIPTNVAFQFDQGKSVFKKSEIEGEAGTRFAAFIAEKNVTRTVTIIGSHSPEGKDRINSELAQERAAAIETWYREQMDKYDYQDMAGQIRFIQKPVIDDWTEFKSMLASYSGLSAAQKSEYNSIINGTGSFEQKEKQLQKLSTYKEVFDNIYPNLRTAKTEVLTVKPKKTPEQIANLALQIANGRISADQLSVEELAYAAAKNPSLEEKKKIYEAAAKKNDTWVIHNNLGAVHLQMAMQSNARGQRNLISTALNHFQISNQKKANVEAQANMGMALAMQAQSSPDLWADALAALDKALGMNPGNDVRQGVSGTKGYIQIRQADYNGAVSTLGRAGDASVDQYNKGLAQLLNKDFRNAQTTLESVISADRAYVWAHYVAAVAAARQENENKVIEHLRNAVGADSSLKQKALNDLEFRTFSGSQAFIDLLK
ncbi:MAG: hypothetical protein Roseis2KO_20510 [Roseivirga sp.]